MNQRIIYTNSVGETVEKLIAEMDSPNVFVITDKGAFENALPVLHAQSPLLAGATTVTVEQGDENKNIDSLARIWKALGDNGATRHSVIVNVGGGVVTDIGGFAAATFKRGVRFINVPTTLLGAVDAAVGGKTGINFNGLKNEVGCFSEADTVIISTIFFNTLPQQQLLSGYAEMLKHGLLENRDAFARLLAYSVVSPVFDSERLFGLLRDNVAIKRDIVDNDPTEHGLRRALNLGHTAGHAFESLAIERRSPIPHGYAVARGLVVALVISRLRFGFPSDTLYQLAAYVRENYGPGHITCDDYPRLLELMSHDKKNPSPDSISFTLLHDVGRVETGCIVASEEITAALDIYRDLMGLS